MSEKIFASKLWRTLNNPFFKQKYGIIIWNIYKGLSTLKSELKDSSNQHCFYCFEFEENGKIKG